MGFAERWAAGGAQPDPSLVRFFTVKVLGIAAPPYSRYFAALVLRLVRFGGEPNDDRGYFGEFVEACLDTHFDPPLPKEDEAMLQQLRTSLML